MEKKGQVEVTFNWIYIVIAGAVILLFFTGIIIKQKAASEERLAVDVVNILDSIFSGAEVSENTKNFVETGALADEILYFSCQDGVGEYGLEGYSYGVQNTVDPIFAPGEIKSPLLILWSLPYYLPFKVMDFLIVTSSNTKYYFIGDGNGFKDQIDLAMGEQDPRLKINKLFVLDINDPNIKQENNFQVRLVFLDDALFQPANLPANLQQMDRLTAVIFSNSGKTVTFYEKRESGWEPIDSADIISMHGDRDAAKFAAIFAKDGSTYKCNMEKVFKRLNYLVQVYGKSEIVGFDSTFSGKVGELIDSTDETDCINKLNDMGDNLDIFRSSVNRCINDDTACQGLDEIAIQINNENDLLGSGEVDCIKLY